MSCGTCGCSPALLISIHPLEWVLGIRILAEPDPLVLVILEVQDLNHPSVFFLPPPAPARIEDLVVDSEIFTAPHDGVRVHAFTGRRVRALRVFLDVVLFTTSLADEAAKTNKDKVLAHVLAIEDWLIHREHTPAAGTERVGQNVPVVNAWNVGDAIAEDLYIVGIKLPLEDLSNILWEGFDPSPFVQVSRRNDRRCRGWLRVVCPWVSRQCGTTV